MDYTVAAIVYIASLLGILTSIYGMVKFRDDSSMVNLMVLASMVFCGTTYLGGLMLAAVN